MSQKILIVDDDPELLRLTGMALHRSGYTPIAAQNAEAALEKIGSEQPALVILDVMLPGRSGIELCRELRNNASTELLPIIMLSARTQVEEKIEGLEAGADDYLTKPISPKELVARVGALLQRTERLRRSPGVASGQVFGFIGAKGGVGTTTLVLNVGAVLAQQGHKIIAAELRPDYGTFDVHLGHKTQERLATLWERANGRFGQKVVRPSLVSDSSGMEVLFGPEQPDSWQEIVPDDAVALVTTLAQMADYVLLDLPGAGSAVTQTVATHCDRIVLVLRPETDSLVAGSVVLEGLKQWGVGAGIVEAVVVNQAPLAMGLSMSQATEQLGSEVSAVIPAAADACAAAVKRGRPLVLTHPDNPAANRMRELSARLAERE